MNLQNRMYQVLVITFLSILLLVVCGGYFVEFILHHPPCSLCLLQRVPMIASAICLLIHLREQTLKSLGVCLVSALVGAMIALRQNSLKFCGGKSMQPVVLGQTLPFWALLIFAGSMIGIAVLLLLKDSYPFYPVSRGVFRLYVSFLVVVVIIGAFSVLLDRGFSF